MVQSGGLEALRDEQKASAERSYSAWSEASPKSAARYGLTDYVGYVQRRYTERDREASEVRQARAASQAAFDKLLGQVEASPDLIRLGADRTGRERFTSRGMLETELRMEVAAADLTLRANHAVKDAYRTAALRHSEARGQVLSDSQHAAFKHIMEAGGLKLVVGLRRTGKSTMLGAAHAAWQAAGFRVRGAALSGIAAENLEKGSGVRSRTLHSLLHQLGQVEARTAELRALDDQLAKISGETPKARRFRNDLQAKRDRAAFELDVAKLTRRDVLVCRDQQRWGMRRAAPSLRPARVACRRSQ